MATTAAGGGRKRRRSPSLHDHEIATLQALAVHRIASTPQLRDMLMPNTKHRWAQDVTSELANMGLVESVPERHTRTGVHFLTEAGHDVYAQGPQVEDRKPKVVTAAGAAGGLQAHTLGVNHIGLAFMRAARERGDECGPFAWRHELAHAYGAGAGRGAKGGDVVVADALLRYTLEREQGARMLARFIELDRSTYDKQDLLAKLRKYAALHEYQADGENTPAWRALYPMAFPQVLIVFANGARAALEDRMFKVLAMCQGDPLIREATGDEDNRSGFVISGVLLEDLLRWQHTECGHINEAAARTCQGCRDDRRLAGLEDDGVVRYLGPFEPVFVRHDVPGAYVNWIGLPVAAPARPR